MIKKLIMLEKLWNDKNFTNNLSKVNLNKEKRQVMFYRDNNYICPDDTFPYPYLKKRNSKYIVKDEKEDNKELSFVPCCKNSQWYQTQEDLYNKINIDYYSTRYSLKTSTQKIQEGQKGLLPENLNNFFKSILPEYKFYRLGCSNIDNETSISCIIQSILNNNHKIKIKKNKLENIKLLRNNIFTTINISLLYQEIFDKNDIEILNIIKNSFFDLRYLYRILEYFFNVNIIVFENNNNIEIEYPYSNNFHVRNFNEKNPIVILFRQANSYEIIYGEDENKNLIFLFKEKEFFNEIKNLYFKKYYYITIDNINYINPYNVSYENIFSKYLFIGQKVDSQGKVYSFNIKLNKDTIITIFVPPTYPLNLPIDKELYYTTIDIIDKYFENKYKIGCDGVFFNLNNISDSIFILVKFNKNTINKKICKLYNIEYCTNIENKELYNIIKYKRLSNILFQLLIWIWRCSGSPSDIQRWYNENFILDLDERIKEPISLPKILKTVNNSKEAILFLNKYWPSVFDKKIYLNRNILFKLLTFIKRIIFSTDISESRPNQILINIFEYKEDFTKYDNNLLFMNDSEFNIYLNKNFSPYIINNIKEFTHEPYLIKFMNKEFIVQGTYELASALGICEQWSKNKINYGYYNKHLVNKENINYYLLERDFDLVYKNKVNNNEFYYIYYHKNVGYNALLPN